MGELIKLDNAELDRIGNKLRWCLTTAIGDRSYLDNTLKRNNEAIEQKLKGRDWPYKGAANFKMPIYLEKYFSLETRLFPLYHKTSPFFQGKPLDAAAEQILPKEESWLDYKFRKAPNFLNAKCFAVNSLGIRDGVGIAKTVYQDKVRKRRFTEKEFNAEDGSWTRKMYKKDVSLSRGGDIKVVQLSDFYLYPFNSRSIDEALQVWERFWMYGSAIESNVRKGNFYEGARRVINLTSARVDEISLRQRVQGITWDIDPMLRPNELWNGIAAIELKMGDGRIIEDELFEVVMHLDTGIILSIKPYSMDLLSDTYHNFQVYQRPDNFYGWGMPELMSQLVPVLDSIMNQWVNQGELVMSPPAIRIGDAIVNNQPWGPGKVIQVDSKDQLQYIQVPQMSNWPVEMKLFIQEMCDKLTGDYDLSSAASGGKRPTKQAIEAITSMLVSRTELFAGRAKQALKSIANSFVRMEYLYGEEEQTVPKGFGNNLVDLNISKDDLLANIDWEAGGQIRGYDQQERAQTQLLLYEQLMKNPLVVGSQAMPPRLDRLWQNTYDLLEVTGTKDIESRIGKKEEVMQQQQQMMQQMQQMQQQGQQGIPPEAQGTLQNLLQNSVQAAGGQ